MANLCHIICTNIINRSVHIIAETIHDNVK